MLGYISPAFEYVDTVVQWFWPGVAIITAIGIGYAGGRCDQRG